jgi:hypothetical protein
MLTLKIFDKLNRKGIIRNPRSSGIPFKFRPPTSDNDLLI